MKPNCYKCEYREQVPGSAHSSCKHPAFKSAHNDPMMNILAIMGSIGRVPPHQASAKGITVKGNSHGISHGWFNHPFNFDPTWLDECSGFKKAS